MARRRAQGAAYRVTVVSIVLNLLLGALKVAAGFAFRAQALVADGLHSLVDLVGDVAVLLGLAVASLPEDERHPYGHHKFANLAEVLIGLLLVGLCLWLGVGALLLLRSGDYAAPGAAAAAVAALSLGVKEFLFHWTRRTARRLRSGLLAANAWHHRVDSLSSLAVTLALLATWWGGEQLAFLDPLLTLLLAFWLLLEGGRIVSRALGSLLDTAPERARIEDFCEHILPIAGARAFHDFRVRRVGDFFEVDLHLQVDPHLSVEEGHAIATRVKEDLSTHHPEIFRVLVHVEPATANHLQDRGISDRE
jgi:cation diffusion facilitator family transporter